MGKNIGVLIEAISVALLLFGFALIRAAPLGSLITSLPGFQGEFPSKHYSGYVTLDDKKTKQMFYYFVESEGNSTKDPVVLWLNGGPGCSSLFGFANEHGPFIFEAASGPFTSKASTTKPDYLPKLHLNPYSWSKVSNIIYIDSPLGVGLSYSLNTSDHNTGDLKTASDLHIFLLKWFEMFPEFLSNRFLIAGESYAGVYVPTLASEIMKGLDSGLRPIINLKGYLIGNGYTGDDFDEKSPVTYAYKMGLISEELYQDFIKSCPRSIDEPNCREVIDKYSKITKSLNTYNIAEPCYDVLYEPDYQCSNCLDDEDSLDLHYNKIPRRSLNVLRKMKSLRSSRKRISSLNSPTSLQVGSNISTLCDDDMSSFFWLNNVEVRKAIHAADVNVTGKWLFCTDKINYTRDAGGMINYHKRLTSMGLHVLIFSGVRDMVIPYIDSEAWTRSLGYNVVDEWKPWISNEQIAGYTVGYDKNLTFLTVKDAGHMVPESKPSEALDFYSRWIVGRKP